MKANATRLRKSRLRRVPKLRIQINMDDPVVVHVVSIPLNDLIKSVLSENSDISSEEQNTNLDPVPKSEEEDFENDQGNQGNVTGITDDNGGQNVQSTRLKFPTLRITEEIKGYTVSLFFKGNSFCKQVIGS